MMGILLLDKPSGMTSHDVVNRLRRAAGIRRVGHTGTLDPAATGLLILCFGSATRLSEFLTGQYKTYQGIMRLGVTTESYDMDGRIVSESAVPQLSIDDIQAVCNQFIGDIQQIPPMVSAVKIGGERLYELARKGQTIDRPSRAVNVREFRITSIDLPYVQYLIDCSSGTYARSLCHDVGQILGCGAALSTLRRTRIGNHDIANAYPLDAMNSPTAMRKALIPPHAVLNMPSLRVPRNLTESIAHGHPFDAHLVGREKPLPDGWIQLSNNRGETIALAEVSDGFRVHPRRILHDD